MMWKKEIKKSLTGMRKPRRIFRQNVVHTVRRTVVHTERTAIAMMMTAVLLMGTGGCIFATEPDDEDMGYINEIYDTGMKDSVTHNERQVDPLTGEAYAYYDDENSSASIVSMDTHCIYDVASYTYIYNYTDYVEDDVRASVYDGMVVNGSVTIEIGSNLNYQLYRNGVQTEINEVLGIREAGYYMLQITTENGDIEEPLSFTIMGDYSNMESFAVPDGFEITKVMMGEETVECTSSQVNFSEEGEYEVSYRLLRSGVEYTYHTTIDHTPPTLKLKELNKKNQARSAVSLADYKNEDTISITLDGKKIDYQKKLTEYGQYHIILQDKAGNITEYDFQILVYISGAGIAFMILFVGVLIGIGVYLRVSKKKLRVR